MAITPRSGLQDVLPDLGKPWWRVPHLVKLNLLLLVPFFTSYLSGYDGSMINGIQTLPSWQEDLHHPSGALLGLLVTMQIIGSVAALPFASYVSDRFGRRHPIWGGSFISIVGVAVQAGAKNMGMFLSGRFLIGFGSIFVALAAAPLLAELAYPTHRPILTAVYNTTWYLGSIVAAWVTYGTFKMENSWSWRIPSLLQAVVPIMQIFLIYLVPESPRWLIANDQVEKATKILSQYHAGTEQPTELIHFEVEEISAAIQFERSHQSVSYMAFFETKANRHRLFIVIFVGFLIQWCGNGLVTQYLSITLTSIGITDGETQNLINGILQIYNLIVACGSGLLVDRLGRRFLFLTSTLGMLLSFIVWTAISARNESENFENKGLGIGVVVMIFVFYSFYNFAMSPLPIAYLLEVLPYTLRTKGLMLFNLAQFSSSIFNGFANPVALAAIGWKYYIVFVCALAVWLAVIYFTFPETRGVSLEEVAQIFDGAAVHPTGDMKAGALPAISHHESEERAE